MERLRAAFQLSYNNRPFRTGKLGVSKDGLQDIVGVGITFGKAIDQTAGLAFTLLIYPIVEGQLEEFFEAGIEFFHHQSQHPFPIRCRRRNLPIQMTKDVDPNRNSQQSGEFA